ncbi:hypothetical protein MMC22_008989 [Lobaria immixta]|nr:hypothetical protein [Lobaria immixta]
MSTLMDFLLYLTEDPLRNVSETMVLILCSLGALIIFSGTLVWRRHPRPAEVNEMENSSRVRHLRTLKSHETASALLELFDKDGAGAWPPKANHDSWPMALRPYKDIYLELIPLLPTAEPSLDDSINNERRNKYRSLMRRLLNERINIAQVEQMMAAVEAGNWDVLARDAYNGFYACVAELDAPWPFFQRNFGVTSEGGNITSNVLHTYNEKGERVYKVNIGMSDLIRSSEEIFFRMFYDVEILAFPIYYVMIRAIISFEENDRESCVNHLENIALRLRHLLLCFYENLTESRVSHSVWLGYVQGFQGWGVGIIVDGEFVKYDGLSGNHVLCFQALDAFLGMDRYLTDEQMIRYIPVNQRKLCVTFGKHSFRNKLKEDSHMKIENEFTKIVKYLKVFRVAHRARAMPYLEQPAPERLAMTAGKSVIEGRTAKETRDALKALDQLLATRLKETV